MTTLRGRNENAAGTERRRGRDSVKLALRMTAACLAAALLAGCTGTSEPRPPTLLIVGIEDAGAPRLLLVEDVTATAPPGSPRLTVVPGGARDLMAPAVALDFENRATGREAAWVLTRAVVDGGGGPEVTAYLQRFAVHEIDPEATAAFAEDVGARLALTLPGGGGVLDGLSLTSPATCPTALQVSRDGSIAAVLDEPAACGLSDHSELWLIDTSGSEPPRALEDNNQLVAAGVYLDQRPDEQRLYFLIEAISNTHVYVDDLDGSPSYRLAQAVLPRRGIDLLEAKGSGDALIALTATELVSIDLAQPALPAVVSRSLTTGAASVVADPWGVAPDVIVLGSSRTAVHEDLADADPDTTPFTAVAAAIDPVIYFAYGVAQGRVLIVDLLTGGGSGETLRVHAEQLAEVTLPDGGVAGAEGLSVIDWVRALTPLGP